MPDVIKKTTLNIFTCSLGHHVGNIVFLQVEILATEGLDIIQGTIRSIMRRLGSRELWSLISYYGIRQT